MDAVKMSVNTFDNKVDQVLSNFMEKPTLIKGVVHLLLMLYVARIAPVPPKPVLDLFANVYFKLFVFSLVLWTAQFSPSTSILIALAFLVTMNYATTGKLWEMLDNVSADVPVAPVAVPVAPVAVPVAPVVAPPVEATPTPAPVVVTPAQSAQAVDLLAKAAVSKSPSDVATVQTVANVAAANATTPQAVAAIQALAQQAVVPQSGTPEKVAAAVVAAKTDIVGAPEKGSWAPEQEVAQKPIVPTATSQETGCYPIRHYDMSAVMGSMDEKASFEDHAPFMASK